MPNERLTEDLVRDHFKSDPLFGAIKLEEQKTSIPKAKQCLAHASKSQTGKKGFPEFVISFPALPDDIIVFECKADVAFHESKNRNDPTNYAVDGALHYSSFLSQEYNVIAIAVSGTNRTEMKVSSFFQKRNQENADEEDRKLLTIFSYIKLFRDDAQALSMEGAEITKTAIELNKELNAYSIVEYERCTLISALLLALHNPSFKASYKTTASTKQLKAMPQRLARAVMTTIGNVLEDNDIDIERRNSMIGEYVKIINYPIAKSEKIKKKQIAEEEPNYVLRDLTEQLEKSILPLIAMGDRGYDVLGRFYREFIRYAGTDKKTGLVLTPQHITEFVGDVVDLNVNDIVYDSCCGTGGFLISAMKRMAVLAGNDAEKKIYIKQNQLVGMEKRPDMFTFACSNMMMSGDGKAHIYQGDSFSLDNVELVKSLKPTVAFLNPPYDVGEVGQLEFIENALSCLQPGGRCAAVVQMSCATSTSTAAIVIRERLLDSHQLLGVFSMPNDLFHPVGVITSIMVFQAYRPHPSDYKVFFGYFKEDGFRKTKHMGRVDEGRWSAIKERWLDCYLNRENVAGLSVVRKITASDEWCAEAYMETDYTSIRMEDFEQVLREYVAFQVKYG